MTAVVSGRPSVLIPIAPGTNRNDEMALAFQRAGAETAQVPLSALRDGSANLSDHQLLALPGGFSYGDALGAGRVWGLDLSTWFADQLREARDRDMPIIGVCNGFQALVSAGLLPGGGHSAALVDNAVGRFECRWVYLQPESGDTVAGSTRCLWTADLDDLLWCPVAHGEGRFTCDDAGRLADRGQVALRYVSGDGAAAEGQYPTNPNGSSADIAGVCDTTGLILGLMPHPEDHVVARQSPDPRVRGQNLCLSLFQAGVQAVVAA